jgi:predicted HTH domain antitoxin
VSIIIPTELKRDLETLKSRLHLDLSTLIRLLLAGSVQEKKLEIAVEEYKAGKKSLGKSAEFADLSLWEFIDELHKRSVGLVISSADIEDEIRRINEGDYDQYVSK